MTQYKTIAESNHFIVLDQYKKFVEEPHAGYQTEGSLEREFIRCSWSRILGNVTAKSENSEKSVISHFKRILTANFEKIKRPLN